MKTGWLIGIVSMYIILGLVFGVANNAWIGSEVTTNVDILMRPFMQTSLWSGITTFFGSLFTAALWQAIYDLVAWNYPAVFHGGYVLIKYILFLALSIGFLFSFGLATIRGTSSS